MRPLDRDRQIVLTVARFEQVTAAHLRAIHFPQHASHTPLYRSLHRLVDRNYLRRIRPREKGGRGLGSGPDVFALGNVGWTLSGETKAYSPVRIIRDHSLAIVDVYVELLRMERAGFIKLLGYADEKNNRETAGGVTVRPDLVFEVSVPGVGKSAYWGEVDMGTERRAQILAKVRDYRHVVEHREDEYTPRVLFIAPDDHRAKELSWWIDSSGQNEDGLFLVYTAVNFASALFN